MTRTRVVKRTDLAVENMRRQRRARAVEALALRMVFGGERKIVIAAPSQQEAEALFEDAKTRAFRLIQNSK